MNKRQIQKVVLSWTGWLLVAIHIGSLLLAFYCIFNAYSISDNGDEADTRWGADFIRHIMYWLIGFTLSSAGILLVTRHFLQRCEKKLT